jgi:pSer/pThr/pTyr-binding forkhead associated (FHA) protein
MKVELHHIERHLQEFIKKNTTSILGTPDADAKLVAALMQAMKEQIIVDSEGNITAPNIFSLNVPSEFVADVRSNQSLLNGLAVSLMEAGEQAGITFDVNITINVFPDETLKEDEFSVRALRIESALSETQTAEIALEAELQLTIPPKAFLIVGGSKIFTLERDVINFGRNLDNHLVIDDPRVSRTHGQFMAVKGRYMLFDLDSSGGTYVNGVRITQINLHPGDVISLAGVPMVYGQDVVRTIDEALEYKPPKITNDSTTSIVKIDETDPDTIGNNQFSQ